MVKNDLYPAKKENGGRINTSHNKPSTLNLKLSIILKAKSCLCLMSTGIFGCKKNEEISVIVPFQSVYIDSRICEV